MEKILSVIYEISTYSLCRDTRKSWSFKLLVDYQFGVQLTEKNRLNLA